MFARAARESGTPEYAEYYARHPDLKPVDDRIRATPPLLAPGGIYFDSTISGDADRFFQSIRDIVVNSETVLAWAERIERSTKVTETIKEMALALGAVAVGCTRVNDVYVYSHSGRFAEEYGLKIDSWHPYAIVFLVEMDFLAMQQAPHAETLRESARQYYRAAVIAQTIQATLARVGFAGKAQYDAHYQVILPPLAVMAGLGELGRNNILVSDRFGSRVRIGAITTSLPLTCDQPIHLGVDDFCRICKKCAVNCPSSSLTTGEKKLVRGIRKWTTAVEQCYSYWRAVGTDCGICMAVCPFSHKNSKSHNLVRLLTRLTPWFRLIALKFDDLIYGRLWRHSTLERNV